MKTRLVVALLSLLLAACGDEPPAEEGAPEPSRADATAHPSGGGDVAVQDGSPSGPPYGRALENIRRRDFDSARGALLEALDAPPAGKEGEIRARLAETEGALRAEPTLSPGAAVSRPERLGTHVSVRGTYADGGDIGRAAQYFWIRSGKRLRCRYGKLSRRDKAVLSSLREGNALVVRGVLRPPWGSDDEPYLDAEFISPGAAR